MRQREIACTVVALLAVFGVISVASYSNQNDFRDDDQVPDAFQAVVLSSGIATLPIDGVTVYLIPADLVNLSPITGTNIINHASEAFDEPLEDLIRNHEDLLIQAVSNDRGIVTIPNTDIDPKNSYFIHVGPKGLNKEVYLPGGDQSRTAFRGEALHNKDLSIAISSRPPDWYDLDLLKVNDVSEVPDTRERHSTVVASLINGQLHFRFFNNDGEVVRREEEGLYSPANVLAGNRETVEKLIEMINDETHPTTLSTKERDKLVARIAQITGRRTMPATHVGTRRCLACHNADKHSTWHYGQTGHRLAWTIPGDPTDLQDFSRFPDWFKAFCSEWSEELGCVGEVHWPRVNSFLKGTHLEAGDFDPTKSGSAKFLVRGYLATGIDDDGDPIMEPDPRVPIKTVLLDIYLWQSATNEKYYITLKNRINLLDPNSPLHLPIELIYGGSVHRQRYIVSVPAAPGWDREDRLYTLLQFNPDGSDRRFDPGRRVWRDYKLSHWWNGALRVFKAPDKNTNTIQAECAGCHMTGTERYVEPGTGLIQVRALDLIEFGAYNIDDDPALDEINIGCESCHGPGSTHSNLIQFENTDQLIVNPEYLTAARSDVICGRCHDRRQGNRDDAATQALSHDNKFLLPGASRHILLTEYSHPDRRGPQPADAKRPDLWPDDVHSSKPRQQYAEHLKSMHHRNRRQLVSCANCHDSHGASDLPTWLKGDPTNPEKELCASCHKLPNGETFDITKHMEQYLHPSLIGAPANCVDCHMVGTSRPAGDAGHYGLFDKEPPFADAKQERASAYWQGHINSHVFDVPKKTNRGVWGVEAGRAMPIPYTARCGSCHNVDGLQFRDALHTVPDRSFSRPK